MKIPSATEKILEWYVIPFLLLALAYFPFFHNLDRLPLQQWDEARVAMSSYEMSENNNFLVVHYDGKPDMWSTKPPLVHWLQVFFIKTLGLNVLSVRLPSAIAGLLTCTLLWFFCVRYLKNHWLAFVCVLVLITTRGFITRHVSRTADYDAPLVLFVTAYSLLYYLFTQTNNYKYLKWFFIALALAVLTKSVAGVFMLPGLLVYSLINYKSLVYFKDKRTYFYAVYFILPVAICFLGRELLNPGYLKAAWYWDMGGRFGQQLTGEPPSFFYYFDLLQREQFFNWLHIAIAGIVLGFLIKDTKIKNLTVFTTCVVLCFLLLLSSAKTQMIWYDAQVFPFTALLVAIAMYWGIRVLYKLPNKPVAFVLSVALIIALAYTPYKNIINSVNPPRFAHEWEHEPQRINYYLIDAYESGKNIDGYVLYMNSDYMPDITFYLKMLEKNKGQHIRPRFLEKIQPGETVMAYLDAQKTTIENTFEYDVIEESKGVKVYKIKGKKL